VTPRRGEVWIVRGRVERTVLVVSGNVYNDLTDPHVLAMRIAPGLRADATVVELGAGQSVIVDTIGRVPKRLFAERVARIDTQRLADVDTSLFKLLATN
jgi:mRNA-degrading endonuclease toxin of MazEF toxin-antitoxin module